MNEKDEIKLTGLLDTIRPIERETDKQEPLGATSAIKAYSFARARVSWMQRVSNFLKGDQTVPSSYT